MCYRTYRMLKENGFRLHRMQDFIQGEKWEFVCKTQQEMGLLSVFTDVPSSFPAFPAWEKAAR